MGAWIEIQINLNDQESQLSHPTWVRGLKFKKSLAAILSNMSHPTWVRGLKFALIDACGLVPEVAPHVGAWIEIHRRATSGLSQPSHPTWVRGLK